MGTNTAAGHAINTGGWRDRVAQRVLAFLYGRKRHYISPWSHCSVGASVVFVRDGKILLGERRGVEHAGRLGLVGGHLDFECHESILDCLMREVYEESGIQLTPQDVNMADDLIDIILVHHLNYHLLKDASGMAFVFALPLTDAHLEQLTETAEAFNFELYSLPEIARLAQQNALAYHVLETNLEKAVYKVEGGKRNLFGTHQRPLEL